MTGTFLCKGTLHECQFSSSFCKSIIGPKAKYIYIERETLTKGCDWKNRLESQSHKNFPLGHMLPAQLAHRGTASQDLIYHHNKRLTVEQLLCTHACMAVWRETNFSAVTDTWYIHGRSPANTIMCQHFNNKSQPHYMFQNLKETEESIYVSQRKVQTRALSMRLDWSLGKQILPPTTNICLYMNVFRHILVSRYIYVKTCISGRRE
jgi:hypothetical protein